jgi:hypothetical protein
MSGDTRRTRDNKAGSREYFNFMSRTLKKYAERADAGELDIDALDQLRELQGILDERTAEVVRAMRSETGGAHSWAEIGRALGITKAAAFKRYGGAETDVRKPGAQPGHLR